MEYEELFVLFSEGYASDFEYQDSPVNRVWDLQYTGYWFEPQISLY